MTNDAQALLRPVFAHDQLLTATWMSIAIRVLRKIERFTKDDELRERLHCQVNALDGLAQNMRQRAVKQALAYYAAELAATPLKPPAESARS